MLYNNQQNHPTLSHLQREGWDALLDLDAFARHITKGLAFESDIPHGYGLGSSGALCAAIYDTFARDTITPNDTQRYLELKALLGKMESFFHGSSSGIDPLISYLNRTVILDARGVQTTDWSLPGSASTFRFFLLDTGIKRQAGNFIRYFLDQAKQPSFRQLLDNILLPANERAIRHTLAENYVQLLSDFHGISDFQLTHLPGLIPPDFQPLWEKSLRTDIYKLKVCGAGGGGFILGFTSDFPQTQALLSDFPLILLG